MYDYYNTRKMMMVDGAEAWVKASSEDGVKKKSSEYLKIELPSMRKSCLTSV